jgi:hypothetical protein
MRDFGESIALGGGGFVGAGEDYYRAGIKPRIRGRLGTKLFLDLSPGIVWSLYDDAHHDRTWPGFVGEVSLGLNGLGSLAVQLERLQVEDKPDVACDCPPVKSTSKDWYVGVRPQSEVGMWAAAGAIAVFSIATALDSK